MPDTTMDPPVMQVPTLPTLPSSVLVGEGYVRLTLRGRNPESPVTIAGTGTDSLAAPLGVGSSEKDAVASSTRESMV